MSLCLVLIGCGPTTKSTSTPSPTQTSTPVTTTDSGTLVADPFADLVPGEWGFVAVPGMVCANGSDTGIGVNLGNDPTRLWVLVAGGGACSGGTPTS